MGQQYFYPSSVKTSQTNSGAIDKSAEAFANSPNAKGGFGQFQKGSKAGYYGTKMWTDAWLAFKSAKAEKRQLRMQAELQRLQAQAYDTAADDVKREGERQVAMISFNAEQNVSTTRVAQGAAGISVGGSGSAAEVIASQRIAADMQINQTLANAVAESWGFRKQAVDARNQALATETSAKMISPWAAAITTHVQGAMKAGEVAQSMVSSNMGGMGGGKGGAGGGMDADGSGGYGAFLNAFGGAGKGGGSSSGLSASTLAGGK